MKHEATYPLTGPNLYCRNSVIVVRVDTGNSFELSSDLLLQRAAELPQAGGWTFIHAIFSQLAGNTEAVSWGALLGSIISGLEEERFLVEKRGLWLKKTSKPGVIEVIVETADADISRRAVVVAVEICQLLDGSMEPSGQARAKVADRLQLFFKGRSSVRFNWTTRMLVDAARQLDIPVAKFLPDRPFAVLGQGSKRKRIKEIMSDDVSAMAATLSKDKITSWEVLHHCFLPVPAQQLVASEAEAQAAVKVIGLPLVVKGRSSDKGLTVSTGLTTPEELKRAIAKVRAQNDQVIIQRHVEGEDFRVTVAYGKVLAAARRIPAQVVGDGRSSIEQLIRRTNELRKQSGPYAALYVQLQLDEEALQLLERSGQSEKSVPVAGEIVRLSGAANISKGGSAVDVTDELHPTIVMQCERAARAFDLSVAGIDIITTDIGRPLAETGGVFIEVNASPGLRPHYLTEPPRNVALQIVKSMFPEGDQGRIPTFGVTGTNGKTTTCRMIATILRQTDLVVGMCGTAGISVGEDILAVGDFSSGAAAQAVLRDPRVDIGVFEFARGGILRRGLFLNDVDVAVVTNVTDDHAGQDGIQTIEELTRIKLLPASVARKGVVLNADDARCVSMAEHVSAPVWWIALSGKNPVVQAHSEAGGNAVVAEQIEGVETIIYRHGRRSIPLLAVSEIPATLGGLARQNVENSLCAAAASLAQGLPMDQVVSGLASFENSIEMSPGRLNIRETGGIRVIYDFVHNVEGMRQLVELLLKLPVTGQRICLLSHDGKRPTGFYRSYTAAVAAAGLFDQFVVSEDPDDDTRADGEVTKLLRDGLLDAGVEQAAVIQVADLESAVTRTLTMVRPGDLLLLTGGFHQPMWEVLDRFETQGLNDGATG